MKNIKSISNHFLIIFFIKYCIVNNLKQIFFQVNGITRFEIGDIFLIEESRKTKSVLSKGRFLDDMKGIDGFVGSTIFKTIDGMHVY